MDDLIYPAASGRGGVIGQTVHPVPPEQRGKPEAELPDEQLKAHGERLRKRLKYFHAQQKTHVKRWEKNRKFVNGEENDDGEKGLVRVNLTASVVNTIQPNIYAKAPEVSVQPEERIDPGEYQQVRGFAKTLELVLNRYAIRGTQLKARGKEAVRASLTCTTGWVKVIFQRDKREDPLVRNRINDAQDNIQRIEQLLRETKDEGAGENYQADLAELRQQIEALEGQVEVVVSEGLVIDNVQPDHVLILDASVKTIDEYAQASGIAHGVYMTVRTYKAQFGGKEPPQKATRYSSGEQTETDSDTARKEGMDPDDELVLVWEVWSKDDLTVYTQCAGASEYCRDPYQPQTLGAQWYPFFPLQLWRVNGLLYARALVDNLIELIDEYNTRRTVAAEHRRKNMPVRLLNKASGITDEDVSRINSRGAGTDVIAIEADPEKPLSNQLGQLAEINYNPAMYDTADILRDIEMVSGAQDASRGGVNQAKTATEAEIMAMGMQSRTSEQLDTIEDWLTAILAYCAQLLLQNLTPAQVKAKFGQSAVWPDLSKKELFEQVMVLIRAGSTSKPNKMRERDQWLQFLPMLQDAIAKIGELREAGMDDMAEAMVKVLDETLRRFDERLSIKEFIPGMDEEEGDDQQKLMKAAKAKIMQMTQEAEAALAEQREALSQQEADLAQRETALQVKEIQQQADAEVASIRDQYDEAMRKVKDREAANAVTEKVQQLLQQHEQRVQQMLAGPDPQQQFDEMRASLLQEVEALVAGLLQPPAEEPSALVIQEPVQF